MPPARAPSLADLLRLNGGALKEYVQVRKGRKVVVTPYGTIVPGGYVAAWAEQMLDGAMQRYVGLTLRQYNAQRAEELAEVAAQRLAEVQLEDNIGSALRVFADNLDEGVEEEIQKIQKLLLRAGQQLVDRDSWWRAEKGKRPKDRETGKLFGYRNVIHPKVTKKEGKYTREFVWPDPERAARARHLRSREYNVETGYSSPVEMRWGWMYPAAPRGTRPTSSRFYPVGVGKPSGKGEKAWTGPKRLRSGQVLPGSEQQNKGQFFLARTADSVLGQRAEKVEGNLLLLANRLVDELEAERRRAGQA